MKLSALHILYLFIAGALGAFSRFVIIELAHFLYDKNKNTPIFPHHTFSANILACFLMGLLASKFTPQAHPSTFTIIVIIGFLGSLSTFSTFIADLVDHFKDRQFKFVIYYSFGTILAGLGVGLIGRLIMGGHFK